MQKQNEDIQGRGKQVQPTPPGFRFSLFDACILFAGLVLGLWSPLPFLKWVIWFVVLHFFLFCNVFRVRPRLEYIWAGIFLLQVIIWSATQSGTINWTTLLLTQLIVTIIVVLYEIKSPEYKGIFHKKMTK